MWFPTRTLTIKQRPPFACVDEMKYGLEPQNPQSIGLYRISNSPLTSRKLPTFVKLAIKLKELNQVMTSKDSIDWHKEISMKP